MATIVIPNIPESTIDWLQNRAALSNRTIEEEVLEILIEDLKLRPASADTGPLAFERPTEGTFSVTLQHGDERLPAPLVVEETTPE